MLEKWFNPTHGLELLPNINTGRRQNENGILFYTEYILLKKKLIGLTKEDKKQALELILNLRSWKKDGTRINGLFDRGQDESKNSSDIRKISHDNLTAISRLSSELGFDFNKNIADYGISNQMRFDNMNTDDPRWLYRKHDTNELGTPFQWHPRDWFYWLYNAGHKWSLVFFPIFLISQIISCMSKSNITSGKLMMFTRCFEKKELPFKITWLICDYILKKKYKTDNWMKPITDIYFGQSEENPIRVLVNKL